MDEIDTNTVAMVKARLSAQAERVSLLKAELAALKARRCETCAKLPVACSIREIALRLYGGREFGCDFWTAREEASDG
jgi:hypothetical protein